MKPQSRRIALLIALAVMGVVGLLLYVSKYSEATPSASIDLKLTREQIIARARKFAEAHGFDDKGALEFTIFDDDERARTYLEYNLGMAKAIELEKNQLPVWFWRTRFCRPLNRDEFNIAYSPQGDLVEFSHAIEDEKKLPTVSHEKAQEIARRFVEKEMKVSLTGWRIFEDSEVPKPNRVDSSFSWRDDTQDFGRAGKMLEVDVAGGQVSYYKIFLGTPDDWDREYKNLRSYNLLLQAVADVLHWTLQLAAAGLCVWGIAKRHFRWQFAVPVAAAVGLLQLVSSLNALPGTLIGYETGVPYNDFIVNQIAAAVYEAAYMFVVSLLVAGAAEMVYSKVVKDKLALPLLFTREALRTREVNTAILTGHSICGAHLGWLTLFYLIGNSFNFFSPLELRNTELLSSTFYMLDAATVGVIASASEELMYRVLALAIMMRVTKSFWLANIIQAAAWGFGHCNYAQEPPYVRGLELMPIGMFYGYMMKRYGLLAPMAAHYLYDAFLGVSPLLESPIWDLKLSGLIPLLPVPLLLLGGMVKVWQNKGFLAENEIEAVVHAHDHAHEPMEAISLAAGDDGFDYKPLSKWARGTLLLISVACAFIVLFAHPLRAGYGTKVTISKDEAIRVARQYLHEHGLAESVPLVEVELASGLDQTELQYFREQTSLKEAADLARKSEYTLYWIVRFFSPEEPEQQLVFVNADGKVRSATLEQRPEIYGKHLDEQHARALAEAFITKEHPEFLPIVFDGAKETRWVGRTDWEFKYLVPAGKVKDADEVLTVATAGDHLAYFRSDWRIPQSWQFKRMQQTNVNELFGYMDVVLYVAAAIPVIWWMVRVTRQNHSWWKLALLMGASLSCLEILRFVNQWPTFFEHMSRETTFFSYVFTEITQLAQSLLFFFAMSTCLIAGGLGALKVLYPNMSTDTFLTPFFGRDGSTRARKLKLDIWTDAVLGGFAAGLLFNAASVGTYFVLSAVSPVVQIAPAEYAAYLANMFSPATVLVINSLTTGTLVAFAAPAIVSLYRTYFKRRWLFPVVTIVGCAIYGASAFAAEDWIIDMGMNLVVVLGSAYFLRCVARNNALSYLIAGIVLAGTTDLRQFLMWMPQVLSVDILLASVFLCAPIAYVVWLYAKNARPAAGEQLQTADVTVEGEGN